MSSHPRPPIQQQHQPVSKRTQPSPKQIRNWMLMAPDEWGYCSRSNLPKPPRSHYDHVTKTLVLCLDHYCPWMFNAGTFIVHVIRDIVTSLVCVYVQHTHTHTHTHDTRKTLAEA